MSLRRLLALALASLASLAFVPAAFAKGDKVKDDAEGK